MFCFFVCFISFFFFSGNILAQNCLEIKSILVDACVPGGGCVNNSSPNCNCEGKNEMVLLKVGSTNLNVSSLTVTWPNNSFLGWVQNAQTATNITSLNSTILGCGHLVEPIGGVLPAGKQVLIITSVDMCTTANSFANLNDTLVVIFQTSGNYQGHFVNQNNGTSISPTPTGPVINRTLTFNYAPLGCSESITYHPHLLVNIFGTYGGSSSQNDGATVQFDSLGNATYINIGCQAPFTPLSVNAGTGGTICQGNTINLHGVAGGTYSSVVWSGGAGVFTTPTTLNTGYTPSFSESGIITLTLTVTSSCGTQVSSSVTINVQAAPNAQITASGPTTFCQGNTVTLSASGGTTYSWSTGATASSITVNSSGTYTVTASATCGSNSAQQTVTVNPVPTPTISGTQTICSGNTITLTASGGGTYSWNTGSTNAVITDSPTTLTTYTATVTNASGCSKATTASVTVNSLPNPSISGNTTICKGDITTLTASGGGPYLWNTGSTNAVIMDSPTTLTTYTATVTNASGCSKSTIAMVNVLSAPNASIAGNNTICSGQNAILTASGGTNYSWNTGATTSSITVNPSSLTNYSVTVFLGSCVKDTDITVNVNSLPVPTISAPTTICNGQTSTLTASGGGTYLWNTGATASAISVNPTSAANYTVTVTNANACSSTTTTSITVNALSVPAITGITTICNGDITTLTASGGTGYSWNTGATTSSITVNPSSLTNYSVVVSDAFGCSGTAMATVIVSQPPVAEITGNNTLCANDNTLLTASGGTNYVWSTGATTPSITVNPASTTNYSVTVSNGLCSGDTSITVTVNASPSVNAGPDFTINQGASVTITGGGNGTYSWSPSTNLSCATCPNPVANPSATTTYTLVITGANGCVAYGNMTVFVTIPECILTDEDIFIPNVFSPNGDGHNDLFRIHSGKPCIKDFKISVYDRWGVVVFKTDKIADWWDGTANGLKVNEGVFFYICDIISTDDQVVHRNGNVTVLK